MKKIRLMIALLGLCLAHQSFAVAPPFTTVTSNVICGLTENANFVIEDGQSIIWDVPVGVTTNWYKVTQPIRILSGGELTISNGVVLHFIAPAGIIVERGGILNITGTGTELTAACPLFDASGAPIPNTRSPWPGIDVRGTSNQDQIAAHQGQVFINDGATISFAESGIEQIGGCAGEGGGIIKAVGANFINNENSIAFTEYEMFKSWSRIIDCKFEVNEHFMEFRNIALMPDNQNPPVLGPNSGWQMGGPDNDKGYAQVFLEDNNGLKIIGSRFYNYFSGNAAGTAQTTSTVAGVSSLLWSHPDWQGSAVYGIGSNFEVRASNLCDEGEIRNEFVGWYYGVRASFASNAGHEVNVSGSDFIDNKVGTEISNSQVITVDENTYNITDGIWYRFAVTNANGRKGLSSNNQNGVYIRRITEDLSIRGNVFDVNLLLNVGAYAGIVYHGEDDHFPTKMRIQGNTFDAAIAGVPTSSTNPAKRETAQGIVLIYGISMFEWKGSTNAIQEFFMDCNKFTLENAGGYTSASHYSRADMQIVKPIGVIASPTINIQSEVAPGGSPTNTFSNYGAACGTAVPDYNAFQIATNVYINYPIHSSASGLLLPTCTTATVTPVLTDAGSNVSTTTVTVTHPSCTYPIPCGTYAATGLDDEEMSMPMSESENGLAIDEPEVMRSIQIYPNPTADLLSIKSHESGTYKVFAIDGREVITETALSAGGNDINVSSLPAGEYILHFTGASTSEVHKFVKE